MRDSEKIGGEFRKVTGAIHRLGVHHVRRQDLRIPMLTRVQVEHEIRECALQTRSQVPIHGEARPGEFCRALQVEHAQLFPDFPVRPGGEIKARRRAPSPDFYVLLGGLSDRHRLMRQIWDAGQNVPETNL